MGKTIKKIIVMILVILAVLVISNTSQAAMIYENRKVNTDSWIGFGSLLEVSRDEANPKQINVHGASSEGYIPLLIYWKVGDYVENIREYNLGPQDWESNRNFNTSFEVEAQGKYTVVLADGYNTILTHRTIELSPISIKTTHDRFGGPEEVIVEVSDETNNITELKWKSGYITGLSESTIESIFNSNQLNEITITPEKTITTRLFIEDEEYTIFAKNSAGDIYVIREEVTPKLSLQTLGEKNIIRINAWDTDENITSIKVIHYPDWWGAPNMEGVFADESLEILTTPGKNVSVNHTFETSGAYEISARCEKGTSIIKEIYVFENFEYASADLYTSQIQHNIEFDTATNKINIEAESATEEITEIKVTSPSGIVNTLNITPAKYITTTYEYSEIGEYIITIKNDNEVEVTKTLYANPITCNVSIEKRTINIQANGIFADISEIKVTNMQTGTVEILPITSGRSVATTYEAPNYGAYEIKITDKLGFVSSATYTLVEPVPMTLEVTQNENNHMKVAIVADGGSESVTSIKVVKLASVNDTTTDVESEGKELLTTATKQVTIEHTFTEIGIYKIRAKDTEGSVIDRIVYAYDEYPVKYNVTANAKTISIEAEGTLSKISKITVANKATGAEVTIPITPLMQISTTYVVQEYGKYNVKIIDELGFQKEVELSLIEEEQEVVEVTVTYSKTTSTNKPVIATITFNIDGVTITNNNGKNTYEFIRNGTFTFEYKTAKGTIGTQEARVEWISPVNVEKEHHILQMENDNYIKKIEVGTKVNEFFNKINIIDGNYKIYDKSNNATQTTTITTGMKLQLDDGEYTLVVTGDINEDGKLSSTDISQLKLHLVDVTLLTGARYQAADMNVNDNVTLTDLSQMKAKMVEM